jgi:hypothetical protein
MSTIATPSNRISLPRPAFPTLRAIILLAGSIRPNSFGLAIQRSMFELPVENTSTILDLWRRQAQDLAQAAGQGALPVRVVLNSAIPAPLMLPEKGLYPLAHVQFERDPIDFRGTGGVLRDLAVAYSDDDCLLVANAAQVLLDPLPDLVRRMAALDSDVALISHTDGTPAGLMLVRCASLRQVPEKGFIDMKEQALTRIAAEHVVSVLPRSRPAGLLIRTLPEYIRALRCYHGGARQVEAADAFAEEYQPAFSIVEPGASVHPSARLHDSIILKGGLVEADAVVVRSIVCAGSVLRRGRAAVDSAFSGPGQTSARS